MRSLFLSIACLLTLQGCVNYVGIHGDAKPLTQADLQTHHSYKMAYQAKTYNWWKIFHDSELNQLMEVAFADSPNLQMAASRVRRVQAIAQESSTALLPTVDMSGYGTREKFAYEGLVPPPFNGHIFNISELGLNFNYEFDFWGKNRQRLAASVSEVCAAEAELAEARLILSSAIVTTYVQLQGASVELSIAKKVLQQRNELLAIIRARLSHGVDSDVPVKTALAEMESARVAVAQYRQAEALTRHQLAELLGKNAFTTDIVTKQFAYHHYQITLPSALPANLLAQRPDIFAARAQAEAAAHQVKAAKALFFPNINLSLLFSYEKIGFNALFEPQNQNNAITGAIDLPIFDAGARRANLRVSYAEYDYAVTNYNKTILTSLREVADQETNLQALTQQLHAQNDSMFATEHNYKLISSRYNHGIVDYEQVLELRGTLLQQQALQADLEVQRTQAVVRMIKALGGNANLNVQG